MKKTFVALVISVAGSAYAVEPQTHVHHVVVVPAIKKPKLLRSNPHRLTAIRFQDVDPKDAPDDEYLCSSMIRRPKLVHSKDQDDVPISDYAKTRLLLARHFALKRHRERWA